MTTVLELPPASKGRKQALRLDRRDALTDERQDVPQGVDLEAIKRAVRTILRAVGEDPDRR